ncbi:unnamed protein product [Phytophthora lilii]|uniref:Unnamed protein product n=1 Tax=Phytophthora lilii TaxID=2077276 RepID=A0A9W6TEK8_9STRA|nr:unnamed protein product [Phytophthora lilii]
MGVVVDSAMNPTSANTTQSSVLRNLIRFGGTGSIMTDKKAAKANQVLPDKPTIAQLKLELRRNIDSKHTQFISFGEAFGAFGIPMLFTLLVSFVWTVWLTFLALAPNYAANLLMDTSSYDNGQFWHINDTYPHITIAAVVGLVVVDICYIFVALRMLFWRDKLLASANSTTSSALFASTRNVHWRVALFIPKYKRIRILWNELTSFEGANRKKWVRIGFVKT